MSHPSSSPRADAAPRHVWWRSLYWRIGVSFVLLVLAVTVLQGVILSRAFERHNEQRRVSPTLMAMDVAFGVSAALARGDGDLEPVIRQRAQQAGNVHVVLRDGRVVSVGAAPLSQAFLTAARGALATTPADPRLLPRFDGPIVTAPVQVNGELLGLVVLPPPARPGALREVARLLSVPGTLGLLVAAGVAALVIFTPARRRLDALERAADRLRQGDLEARAPDTGGDEIARVAQAFNRMGEEIAARDQALREADRVRRQMLADVSHELKTPLTAMRGFIETLQMPAIAGDSERRSRYFETLSRETRRLERLVADLLDVARFEQGATAFQPQLFDTARLFEQVAGRHEPSAQRLGVALTIDVAPEAEQTTGDPHRLEQAVDNLVANALRHTPRGGTVCLAARLDGDEVCLVVTDTGAGIPTEHVPHVFDRFYKADASRAGAEAGSGLGLSIVRAIVLRHGGRVEVESRPGHTSFTLRLPAG